MSQEDDRFGSRANAGAVAGDDHDLWRGAMEAAGDVAYRWDLGRDTLDWAGGTLQLFGLEPAEMPRSIEGVEPLLNIEDQPRRLAALAEIMETDSRGDFDCEYRVRDTRGDFHWVHDRGGLLRDPAGRPVAMLGSLRRITERKRGQARLEFLANFDELTGHFNKIRLRDALEQALAVALRQDRPGAFLVVSLDGLERISAALGHETSDEVMLAAGHRLESCLRAVDVIGRLGDNRFGAIIEGCGTRDAKIASERILARIQGEPVDTASGKLNVSGSCGIVIFPDHARTSFDVMTKAETALLAARNSDRDAAQVYELSEDQRISDRQAFMIGEEVKAALRENRMLLAFQPVVSAQDRSIRFFEGLLRMRTAEGEIVPAAGFITIVERLGLTRAIDRHVLDLALATLESTETISIAVNISGFTAADRSWLRALVARLRSRPEIAQRLIVEITETAALHDIEETARFVSVIRGLGCRVALDDFGAGFTTFRHLKSLSVDIVKLDGSFVRSIATSTENQLFVRNLLALTQAFKLETVAECVEDPEEAAFLEAEGLDFLQGYHIGRPELSPDWRDPGYPLRLTKDQSAQRFAVHSGLRVASSGSQETG